MAARRKPTIPNAATLAKINRLETRGVSVEARENPGDPETAWRMTWEDREGNTVEADDSTAEELDHLVELVTADYEENKGLPPQAQAQAQGLARGRE